MPFWRKLFSGGYKPRTASSEAAAQATPLQDRANSLTRASGAICDICGADLTASEVQTVRPNPVVDATKKGYVPSNLPPKWKQESEAHGISLPLAWAELVRGNSNVDWGLCRRCLDEVSRFNSRSQAESLSAGEKPDAVHLAVLDALETVAAAIVGPKGTGPENGNARSDGVTLATAAAYCVRIMAIKGETATLNNASGMQISLSNLHITFRSYADDLLTENVAKNVMYDAINKKLSTDQMSAVIHEAMIIVARQPN